MCHYVSEAAIVWLSPDMCHKQCDHRGYTEIDKEVPEIWCQDVCHFPMWMVYSTQIAEPTLNKRKRPVHVVMWNKPIYATWRSHSSPRLNVKWSQWNHELMWNKPITHGLCTRVLWRSPPNMWNKPPLFHVVHGFMWNKYGRLWNKPAHPEASGIS